jgi:hypothetical protein
MEKRNTGSISLNSSGHSLGNRVNLGHGEDISYQFPWGDGEHLAGIEKKTGRNLQEGKPERKPPDSMKSVMCPPIQKSRQGRDSIPLSAGLLEEPLRREKGGIGKLMLPFSIP